jgi:hypothetical protein
MLAQPRQEGVALSRVGLDFDDQGNGGHETKLLAEDWDGPMPARGATHSINTKSR